MRSLLFRPVGPRRELLPLRELLPYPHGVPLRALYRDESLHYGPVVAIRARLTNSAMDIVAQSSRKVRKMWLLCNTYSRFDGRLR
jgi:hypothetical protein